MRQMLETRFSRTAGTVEIRGRTFSTHVWIPDESFDSLCYYVAEADGRPPEDPPQLAPTFEQLQSYSHWAWNRLRFSEALAPDERSHLPSEFIRPNLNITNDSTDPSNATRAVPATVEGIFNKSKLILMGSPGAGKTSFLRWYAIQIASAAPKAPETCSVPLYFRLASLRSQEGLWQSIADQTSNDGFDWLVSLMPELADSGRLLLLLDGLDEVSDHHRIAVVGEIRHLLKTFPLVRLWLTCRKASYVHISDEFELCEISPFTHSQIAEWTFKRLHDKPERSWKAFANLLFANQDVLEMASNPLLLNILTHVYTRQNVLPSSRALLVQSWLDALLNQWDHVRGVSRSQEYWASPRRKYTALCRAAFNVCLTNESEFSEPDFLRWETSGSDSVDADKTLFALHAHSGVVSRRANSDWQFAHQLLLEHCAASYLVEGPDDAVSVLGANIHQTLWQNIWLQACALSQDGSRLLTLITEHSNIDRFLRATLVCKAFTQPIRVETAVLKLCISFLSDTLAQSPVITIQDVNLPKCTRRLWGMIIGSAHSGGHQVTSSIALLSKSIFEARHGALNPWIREQVRTGSTYSGLLCACDYDGVFDVAQRDEGTFLLEVLAPDQFPQSI